MPPLNYHHVDVFTPRPFAGNSLAVFPDSRGISPPQMLAVTQELRHFESIFLEPTARPNTVKARIFDLAEELDFAGHPLLGAASVLHTLVNDPEPQEWSFILKHKTVTVITEPTPTGHAARLNQGRPEFLSVLPTDQRVEFAAALNLEPADLSGQYSPEVVSTGLRYLVFPIVSGLERAQIVHSNFAALLETVNAQFVYLLDIERLEGRHWNNDGLTEDVATGSAAGTVGAYLVKHGRMAAQQEFTLRQGRFVGRPSEIRVRAEGSADAISNVQVSGHVARVGRGVIEATPEGKG